MKNYICEYLLVLSNIMYHPYGLICALPLILYVPYISCPSPLVSAVRPPNISCPSPLMLSVLPLNITCESYRKQGGGHSIQGGQHTPYRGTDTLYRGRGTDMSHTGEPTLHMGGTDTSYSGDRQTSHTEITDASYRGDGHFIQGGRTLHKGGGTDTSFNPTGPSLSRYSYCSQLCLKQHAIQCFFQLGTGCPKLGTKN